MSSERYYDTFATSYDEGRDRGYHRLIDRLESELVLPYIRGGSVLEVGCGTGLILERLDRTARLAVGIDQSTGMLGAARRRGRARRRAQTRQQESSMGGLAVTRGDALALPFADASFDVCCSFKVLSHIEALPAALAEIARVVRPGGRLFIEVYNRHSLRYLIRRLRGHGQIAPGVTERDVYTRFYRQQEIIDLLPAGLALTRVHGVRVATVLPQLAGWPITGPLTAWVERSLRSSPLARFGGFLVLECVKHGTRAKERPTC